MVNILLACSAGMSTSLLVEKMKAAALNRNLDITIQAVSVSELNEDLDIGHLDCILLGPQARYGLSGAEEYGEEHNCPVDVIPQNLYGSFDGDKVLDFALEMIANR